MLARDQQPCSKYLTSIGLNGYIDGMTALSELGMTVRTRRAEMGLTQQHLAKLSGLSRTTVNQIENGSIRDLSLGRATRLVEVLGLWMGVSAGTLRPTNLASASALAKAARSASVSYKKALEPETLRSVLLHGATPMEFQPHVRAVLEEAPISMLAAVVDQLHHENQIERSALWTQMRTLARGLQSYREVWL